jgi:hypothetical protein
VEEAGPPVLPGFVGPAVEDEVKPVGSLGSGVSVMSVSPCDPVQAMNCRTARITTITPMM